MSSGIPVAETRASYMGNTQNRQQTQHFDISSQPDSPDVDYMDEDTAPAPLEEALEIARQSQQEARNLMEVGLETHRAQQQMRDHQFSAQLTDLGQQLRDALIQGYSPLIQRLIDQANAQATAQQQLQISYMSDLDRMRRQQVRRIEPALSLEDRPRAKAKSMPSLPPPPLPPSPSPSTLSTEISEYTSVPSSVSTMTPSQYSSQTVHQGPPTQTPKKRTTNPDENPEDTHEPRGKRGRPRNYQEGGSSSSTTHQQRLEKISEKPFELLTKTDINTMNLTLLRERASKFDEFKKWKPEDYRKQRINRASLQQFLREN
jgi:hypothetical protein